MNHVCTVILSLLLQKKLLCCFDVYSAWRNLQENTQCYLLLH